MSFARLTSTCASPPTRRSRATGLLVAARRSRTVPAGRAPSRSTASHHLVSQVPVLGESEDAVGAHLGTVMVARARAVDVGAAAEHVLLPVHLPRHRLPSAWVARGSSPDGSSARLAEEPREIAGLAEHREAMLRGIAEAWSHSTPSTGSPSSTRWRAGSTCPSTPSAPRSRTCASRGGSVRSWWVRNTRDTADHTHHVTAARDEWVTARERQGARHEHHAGGERRPRARHGTGHGDARPGRPRAGDRSFRSTAHVLRAQAHEFANQLHTISGLIQIGSWDEVVR